MYEVVECTQGCGKTLRRQYLSTHVLTECTHRKINCQYCNLSGIHCFITLEVTRKNVQKLWFHVPIIVKQIISFVHEDMDEHRKVCSLEVVSCNYMKLGCGTRMARKEVEEHGKVKVEEHLCLATERLENLERL